MRTFHTDNGMVTCTKMGYRKKFTGQSNAHSVSFGTSREVQPFYVAVASLTSSGGRYYYDATHNIGTLDYLVNVYDMNGVELFPSEQNRGLTTHRVWLDYNTSAFTIVIY